MTTNGAASPPAEHVGTVETLWRYPVKSMLGEQLVSAALTERGLEGDRTHALLDVRTGRVASAKNPHRWRKLLSLTATAARTTPRITGPDGAQILPSALTAVLGHPVALTAAPPPGASIDRADPEQVLRRGMGVPAAVHEVVLPAGTFYDYSRLHLITTATLDRLAQLSPSGPVDARRYRPNLVIRTGQQGFVEDGWVGRVVAIGADVRLRILVRTPRCAVPTLAHGALPRNADALRVLAEHNRHEPVPGMGPRPCAGVHAEVLQPGHITRGDPIVLL